MSPQALIELFRLLALALLLVEAAAQLGSVILKLWRVRLAPLAAFGAALALGWVVVGAAGLGWGLVGAFRPPVLLAGLLAPAAVAAWQGGRRSLVLAAAREWRGILRLPARVGLAVAAFPVLARWAAPEGELDAYIYHLGAPLQWLVSGRALFTGVGVNYHLPLPTEMAFALALALDDERLAHAVIGSLFLAAASVFASPRAAGQAPWAAWLGPLLAVAGGHSVALLCGSKSDLAAAFLLATAAGLWSPGRASVALAGALLGAAAAAKLPVAVLGAAWICCHRSGWRAAPLAAAFGALPLLPWAVTSWLVLGNPLFPLFFDALPTLGWGAENAVVRRAYFEPWRQPGADSLAGEWARARGIPETPVPAEWEKHGRKAGPIRNEQMLAMKPVRSMVMLVMS